MNSQTKNKYLESLLEALSGIRLLLNRDNEARFIAARPTLSELKRQSLPDHLRMSVKKRKGARIRVRRSRSSQQRQFLLARWPQDHLIETTTPSIACVVRGAADLHINDYVLHCQQGDIVFYPVGVAAADGSCVHLEGDVKGRRCSILWIFPGRINEQGLVCYLCHSNEQTHSSETHFWFKNHLLAELFQGIYQEEEQFGYQECIYHLLLVMLQMLQREGTTGNAMIAPYDLHLGYSPHPGHDPIEQACDYIDTHLNSNLTITLVAKHVGLSPAVFTKRFKQQTNQTFNEYCTACRLKSAAILLETTELRISEISYYIGLTDCQFRLLARKYWQCTPGEFRQKISSK
jgi:AraC-like DNA-binding protein